MPSSLHPYSIYLNGTLWMREHFDVWPVNHHPYSIYLNGTLWMREHFDVWPVNQNPGEVPEEEIVPIVQRILTVGAEESSNWNNDMVSS